MASVLVDHGGEPEAGAMLIGCVAAHGSASHPYPAGAALAQGPEAARNLADAIHFLCALHGRYPGIVELAASRTIEPAARGWLGAAAEAFTGERAFLARLAAAAGPQPATPGSGSEAALITQQHAITTLARSERRGCALGAALALALDWRVVRGVLNAAAERFGVQAPPCGLGDTADAVATAHAVSASAGVRRALLFGAEQVSLQHRALWDLLRARAEARAG